MQSVSFNHASSQVYIELQNSLSAANTQFRVHTLISEHDFIWRVAINVPFFKLVRFLCCFSSLPMTPIAIGMHEVVLA